MNKELSGRVVQFLIQPKPSDSGDEIRSLWEKYKTRAGITESPDLSKYSDIVSNVKKVEQEKDRNGTTKHVSSDNESTNTLLTKRSSSTQNLPEPPTKQHKAN